MLRITAATATVAPTLTRHPLQGWPIDRSNSPESKPLILQMAEAVVDLRERNGIATEDDLKRLGFLPSEISCLRDAVKIRATKLRPDLATDAEKIAAGLVSPSQVA